MPFNILNSVAKLPKNFGGVKNLWVAVGDMINSGNPFYSSSNGKNTWTQGTGTTGNYYASVAHGKGTWVAVTLNGNEIAYSMDGKVWQTTTAASYFSGRGVAYGKDNTGADLWVIAGGSSSSSLMFWSTNGINWNSSSSIGGSTGLAVAYGKDASNAGLWVATATDLAVKPIKYSSTGKGNWVDASVNTGAVNTIAYGKDASGAGLWIAGAGNILKSVDGKNWITIPYITGGIYSVSKVAYGKDASGAGLWVAGSGFNPFIAYSSNGNDWSATTSTERNGCGEVNSVAYGKDGSGNGLWLINGINAGYQKTFFHSQNGKNWTQFLSTDKPANLDRVRGIAFNNVDL
jgi:hypothetical protein